MNPCDTRLSLLHAGFSPLPITGKVPPMVAWQKVEATADQIRAWDVRFPDARNTGFLTRVTPVLDVDIKNPEAAADVEELVRNRLDQRGVILVRFGREPKRAIPLRTDVPFKKISANFEGTDEKLELLADGQQVVAFGLHKDTRKPYRWFGGEPGKIGRDELPDVTADEARELVEAAAALLVERHGYIRVQDRPKGNGHDTGAGADDWAHLAEAILAGRQWHDSLRDYGAKLVASGTNKGAAVNILRGLMHASTAPHDERWQDRYDDIPRLVDSATEPPQQPAPALLRLDLTPYDTKPIPPREWGVPDRFPRRNVALLSGHGGAGKSILLLQLAVAHVARGDWLHSRPAPGPVLLFNCEDDGDELARRLRPIAKHYGTTFATVAAGLHVFPMVEAPGSPLLAHMHNGTLRPTPLYTKLLELVREIRPVCTIIDNVADVFGGNEIDRVQVRQFLALMRRLALAANGYVILSAHPSVAGMASKSGLSGSTQWHNSVRARAYLHTPSDKEAADDESDTSARVLEFMKSNYAPLAEQIELTWKDGLYLPKPTTGPEAREGRDAADKLFLELLDRTASEGANVSGSPAANNYAPRVFAKRPEAKGARIGERAFANALSRLIETDKIRAEPYGPPAKRMRRLAHRRLV